MSAISINGTTYPDFLQAFAGNATTPALGQYYAIPPWGHPPTESAFQYQEQHITFPGVLNAMGTKRIAFGPRVIACELIIVGNSKANATTTAAARIASMNQLQRYTISLPDGVSRPGCKLLNAQGDDWIFSFSDAWAALISCNFIQLQES